MTGRKTGTYEWAQATLNFLDGCSNNCSYCFWKNSPRNKISKEDWVLPKLNRKKANTKLQEIIRKYKRGEIQTVMMPSTHDIYPEWINVFMEYARKILRTKMNLLIVTKPRKDVIREICMKFDEYKDQILFRFTIGSLKTNILERYEPGAPSFEQRFNCLKYAFGMGYETSVSIEPYLDENPLILAKKIAHLVSETIWLGAMNHGSPPQLKPYYSPENMRRIYGNVMDNLVYSKIRPKIRFKDSFRKIGVGNRGETI